MTTPAPSVHDRIQEILQRDFQPVHLHIKDNSHLHAGHAGARPEGETHFHVTLVSAAFAGKSRVARQRAVNHALAELLETRIHALQLRTLTPEEHALSG